MTKLSRALSLLMIVMLLVPSMALGQEKTEAELLADKVAKLILPTPSLPLTDEPVTISLMYPKPQLTATLKTCSI